LGLGGGREICGFSGGEAEGWSEQKGAKGVKRLLAVLGFTPENS